MYVQGIKRLNFSRIEPTCNSIKNVTNLPNRKVRKHTYLKIHTYAYSTLNDYNEIHPQYNYCHTYVGQGLKKVPITLDFPTYDLFQCRNSE